MKAVNLLNEKVFVRARNSLEDSIRAAYQRCFLQVLHPVYVANQLIRGEMLEALYEELD